MNWFKRKKVNQLKSNTELVAAEVRNVLNDHFDEIDYKEVLNAVLSKVLPGTSVHGKPYSKNPKSIYKGKVPAGITSRQKFSFIPTNGSNLESER